MYRYLHPKPARLLTIRRQSLVEDLLLAYEDVTICESLIEVKFLEEDAIDIGGVTRELFSSFFDQVINSWQGAHIQRRKCHHGDEKQPIVGRILCHSYTITNCFPTSLSLFLGNAVTIDSNVLLNCFYQYLPAPESELLRRTILDASNSDTFDDVVQERLLDIYATNGLHRIPRPSNVLKDILHLANYALCLLNAMLSSLPDDHLVAWRSLSPSDFLQNLRGSNDFCRKSNSGINS